MDQPDFESIASQLRNPNGADGIKTAIRMSENNAFMITSCIDSLHLQTEEKVLEMGPGGGLHLPYLFQQEPTIQYSGIDISETMIEMASEKNAERIANGSIQFNPLIPKNGFCAIPFEDDTFDKIFTVNTLYFWDNALQQAKELLRVLKPEAQIAIAFAQTDFMKQMPFTQYNFNLYSDDEAVTLLLAAGFKNIVTKHYSETVSDTVNGDIERSFTVLMAEKGVVHVWQ